MKRLYLLLMALLTLGVSGAWAETYSVTLGSQVTELSTLSASKYYVLKNCGSSLYNYYDGTQMDAKSDFDYSCVVSLNYDGTNVTIKQVSTGTYYQGLVSDTRLTLGAGAVNYTFNTDGVDSGQFRFANNSLYMNRTSSGTQYPMGYAQTGTGAYSRWNIYEVTLVEEFPVSLPENTFLSVGEKATTFTAATSANDNAHWYIMTQTRGGETPIYNAGVGSTVMRAATSVTTSSLNQARTESSTAYLVRFIDANDGLYNIQFADGCYINASLQGAAGRSSAGTYAFYNTVADGTTFGWNLNSNTGNIVDNNGAGSGLAFWSSGTVTATSGNNVWSIYPVSLTEGNTLTYNLTDVNGAVYTGSYTGYAGTTEPTLTGCDGYTLTDGSWSGTTYSATINFPFAVSSNSVTNWTYIGSFHNKNGYSSNDFLWHASGTNVIVHSGDVPDNTKSEGVYTENEKYKWAIYPTFTSAENKFTFTIKNSSTGTYINNTTTGSNHTNSVTLSSTATPLQYATGSTTNCGTIYKWYIPSTSNYLSVSTINGGTDQVLGVHNVDHDGLSIGFYTPADFATLEANLATACNAYTTFKSTHTIGTGLGEYLGSSYSDMETALSKAQNASSVYTAAQLTTDIATLENLSINQPSGMFVRFYSPTQSKYMGVAATDKHSLETDKNNAGIYYVTDDNHIVSYKYGQYLANAAGAPHAAIGNTGGTFTFSESDVIGKYYVYCGGYLVAWDSSGKYYTDRLASPNAYARWEIEAVDDLPVTFAGEYASFYSPVDLTIPENVEVYTGTLNDEWLTLNAVEGTLPANTGVILRRKSSETTTVNFTVLSTVTSGTSALTGTVAAAAAVDGGVLVLGKEDDTWGIYKYEGTLGGFKAYMNMPESGVKGLRFRFDDTTGITAAEVADRLNGAVYNLAGQRVQQPARGLYIVSGKKVLIK